MFDILISIVLGLLTLALAFGVFMLFVVGIRYLKTLNDEDDEDDQNGEDGDEGEAEAVEKEGKIVKPKKYAVDEALFPARIKKADRADYVTRALRYIMEHEIEL